MRRLLGTCTVAIAAVVALQACSGDNVTRPDPYLLDPTAGPAFTADVNFNNVGACMQDDYDSWPRSGPGNLNCTSNDISIATAIVTMVDGAPYTGNEPIRCTGQTVQLEVAAVLTETANSAREDVGIWIDETGGDALTGTCRHYNLLDGDDGTFNLDNDNCAGIEEGASTTVPLGLLNVVCEDPDGDGNLFIGACLGWDVPGNEDECEDDRDGDGIPGEFDDFRAGTLPTNKAKCNCDGFEIPVIIQGTIVIEKQTTPAGGTGFGFTDDIEAPNSFSLDDDGQKIFQVDPGTYSVVENDPTPGYDLTSLQCTDASGGTTTNLGARSASIDVDPGETVTCVFTNTQRGTIEIEKQTEPNGETESFSFTDDIEAPNSFNLIDDGVKQFLNVVPGAYSVTEGAEDDFNLTNIQCDDANSTGDTGDREATINLEAGETVRCVFTNTIKGGTVIIEKQTDPDGETESFSFTDDIEAPNAFNLQDDGTKTFLNVLPGPYSVTEGLEDDFNLTDITCVDGDVANSSGNIGTRTATINVEPDETVTCTFTNTIKPGTIIIEKETDPDGGTGFGFTDDIEAPNSFSLDDDGSKTFLNVLPGQYSVTEDDPTPGYDLTNLVCDDANSTESVATRTATINLEPDETVTCTFTNTERAMVTLNKVENGTLPLSIAFAFEIRVGASVTESGTVVATGSANTTTGVVDFSCSPNPNQYCENDSGIAKLVPGDYAVCETDMLAGWANNIASPPGYTPDSEIPEGSDNGTECVDVTLVAGQTGSPPELPDPIDNTPPPGGDARTIGYWKNHSCMAPGNQDDVLSDNLPIQLTDTWLINDCATVVYLLNKSDLSNQHRKRASDAAYNLAAQLAAALLNVNAGAGTCPAATTAIDQAQALLASINFDGTGQYLRPQQALYTTANNLAAILDDYNNNDLCPAGP